ncbi:MAG: PAS domain-containing protein [Bacteroidia bacterium]|jgi:chemotaxis protein|nr:PAS domain-containing protein [Bacteroidia bacterium]
MRKQYDRVFVLKFPVSGFVAGLVLVLLVFAVQILYRGENLSLRVVGQFHNEYPMLYLVDLLPFLLGGAMWFFGRRVESRREMLERELQANASRSSALLKFVNGLRQGDEHEFVPDADDELGKALLALQKDIEKRRAEDEERREEDTRRNWVAEGLAKFAEILREETGSLEDLGYSIVSHLVKYVKANQCGFYVVEEEGGGKKYFQLLACYAYDRKKFANRRIEWGDGLVGACALEGATTHLDRVPDGYLEITSGLGKATAQNLLLVPIKLEEVNFGVLEIASFHPFAQHVIDFIERVAGSIASTLSSKRINMRTEQLLAESRQQAETLVAQEERMRSNMEELQKAQEEATRANETFLSFANSVNHTLIRAEYSTDGTLQYANQKFVQKLEYESEDEVLGKHISLFISSKDKESFNGIWEQLVRSGKPYEGDIKHVTRTGKDLWTTATYTCQYTQGGVVEKILFLAIDTTHDKKQNLDWQGQIDALNRVSLKAEITPLGDVMDVNQLFLDTLKCEREDVLHKPLYNLVPKNERALLEHTVDGVCRGESFKGTIRVLTNGGEECWLRATMTTVNDMYGDISKIVLIANDITREKLMEIESKRQNEQLKQQEEMLRQNEVQLNKKLREAREEVKNQFKEIEKVQIRNEKTLEGFLDAIITTDQDGVVEFFNKAAEELFEIDRTEVLGQNVRLLFPDSVVQDSEFLKAYLDPHGEKVVGERKEVKVMGSSGEEKDVLMLLSEARVGRKVSYTAFIQNISLDLF